MCEVQTGDKILFASVCLEGRPVAILYTVLQLFFPFSKVTVTY